MSFILSHMCKSQDGFIKTMNITKVLVAVRFWKGLLVLILEIYYVFSMQVVCLGSIFMFNLSKHRIRGGNVPLCNFCSLVCEGLRTTSIQRAQNSKFPGGIPGILSWRLFGIAGHGATARHLSCLRRATPCPSQRSFSDRSRGLPGR